MIIEEEEMVFAEYIGGEEIHHFLGPNGGYF
jgi:hypothetical protein